METLRRSLSARRSTRRPSDAKTPSQRQSFRRSVSRRTSGTRQAVAQRASLTKDSWKRRSSRAAGFFKSHLKSARSDEDEPAGSGFAYADDEAQARIPLDERGFRRRTLTRTKRTTIERRYSENAKLAAYADADDVCTEYSDESSSSLPTRNTSALSSSSTGASRDSFRRTVTPKSMIVSDQSRLSLHSRSLTTRTEKAIRKLGDEEENLDEQDDYRAYIAKRNSRKSTFV